MGDKKLTRIPAEGQLAGVCAGFARYLDIDVSWIRIGVVFGTLLTGGGLAIGYLVLAILMPTNCPRVAAQDSGSQSDEYVKENIDDLKRELSGAKGQRAKNFLGLGIVLLGVWLLIGQWYPDFLEVLSWEYITPIAFIVLGLYIVTRKDSSRG